MLCPVVASTVGAASCSRDTESRLARARLTARPSATTTTARPGTHELKIGAERDAVLRLPDTATALPLPLVVLLHGAGGSGRDFLEYVGTTPGGADAAILAPDSGDRTWDAVLTRADVFAMITQQRRFVGFGPDVIFLNRALERVFSTVAIDASRIAVGGFSDGATYALSLGLINGDLFRRIVAFSPGFVINGERRGRPDVFISHGRHDQILPIDRCSRRIVPQLQAQGYRVTFREFDGGHGVPEPIAREGLTWATA
jgi:phospholipase/carboxylesterase